jgi:hypothetical protein
VIDGVSKLVRVLRSSARGLFTISSSASPLRGFGGVAAQGGGGVIKKKKKK